MSSMLEQAIVDAAALKEAALKNAETQILEKYAPEIKDAVDRLLNEAPEDEELGLEPEEPGVENPMDPMGGEEDPAAVYNTIRGELAAYGHGLTDKAEIVALSQVDLIDDEARAEKQAALAEACGKPPLLLSSLLTSTDMTSLSFNL